MWIKVLIWMGIKKIWNIKRKLIIKDNKDKNSKCIKNNKFKSKYD